MLNDLLDLEADRAHPSKRFRPFASGELDVRLGALLIPALLATAFGVSYAFLEPLFMGMIALYAVATTAYSFVLKRVLILDVIVLAGLYTMRIMAGAVATGVEVSPWLFAFSMFLFLSLAFLKRFSELRLMEVRKAVHVTGRGYALEDLGLLQSLGSSSGYLSVLVLALYTSSREVTTLYQRPALLWLIGPCVLYWMTRMWFKAQRGVMNDDPVVHAIKDPISYGVGFMVLCIMLAAALPLDLWPS